MRRQEGCPGTELSNREAITSVGGRAYVNRMAKLAGRPSRFGQVGQTSMDRALLVFREA